MNTGRTVFYISYYMLHLILYDAYHYIYILHISIIMSSIFIAIYCIPYLFLIYYYFVIPLHISAAVRLKYPHEDK